MLYQRLVSALPGHIVLSDVALPNVLGVKRGFDFDLWSKRIRRLQYDFVVYASDASAMVAIEVDDKPGERSNGAYGMKERASAAAGIRLLRWQAKALPDQAAIQALFGELQMPFFEETGSSANQSWWPAIANNGRNPPRT